MAIGGYKWWWQSGANSGGRCGHQCQSMAVGDGNRHLSKMIQFAYKFQ